MLTMHAALVASSLIGPLGRFSIAGYLILIGRGLILVRGCLVAVGRRLILVRGRLIHCKQNRVVNDTPLFSMGKLLPIRALQLVFRVSQLLTSMLSAATAAKSAVSSAAAKIEVFRMMLQRDRGRSTATTPPRSGATRKRIQPLTIIILSLRQIFGLPGPNRRRARTDAGSGSQNRARSRPASTPAPRGQACGAGSPRTASPAQARHHRSSPIRAPTADRG